MDLALQPVSDAGRALVLLCERHEAEFFARASQHDRDGSFPEENTADLIKSGVIAATVPSEFGGLDVMTLRDQVAGMNRLGRGDGSTAIAVNMHLWRVWIAARAWRAAKATGDTGQTEALAAFLSEVSSGRRIMSSLATEYGHDLLHPMTEAVRDGEGWRLNGRKGFATGSPVATHLGVLLRFRDADEAYHSGTGLVERSNPGVKLVSNWDALGMRGSGSHDVIFENCFLPKGAVTDGGPWGELTPRLMFIAFTNPMGLVAAFLGIAECARAIALQQIMARGRAERATIQHLVAEMEIDLAAARAVLERCAACADALLEAYPVIIPTDDLRAIVADFQCVKHFVTRKAIDIVDHAMTVSGGAGYMSANPLSRLYRDVRAGPFMQPYSPIEAFELIGKIALGLPV
jgi:alkylation response protein AidB-like acyl-CoA dehydrogenase